MTFSSKEAFSFAWDTTKKHITKLLGVTLVFLVVQLLLSYLADLLSADGSFLEALLTFIVWLATFFLTMGYLKVFLNVLDDKEFDIITLFEERDEFWNFVGASILQAVVVILGLILLIVPGIYWALKYSQVQYLVIDKGLAPFEAFKESAKIMDGVKWKYLLFGVALGLINIAGAIVFMVGLLVTIPFTSLAAVYVYRHLNEQAFGLTTEVVQSEPVVVESSDTPNT